MAGSGIAGGIANGTRAARRAGQGLVLAAGLAAGMAAGLGAGPARAQGPVPSQPAPRPDAAPQAAAPAPPGPPRPRAAEPGPAEPVTRAGYFYIGGRYQKLGDKTVMVGQMFVQSRTPARITQPYPVVMVHGLAQTGVNYLATADGRPGWVQRFVEKGYQVYVVDQVGRGRSGTNPEVYGPYDRLGTRSLERTHTAPEVYDLYPQAKLHTRWPEGPGVQGNAAFDQFFASQVPFLANSQQTEEWVDPALVALLDRIGPAILVTHGQAALFGWAASDARPDLVKAHVAVEPNGPPFFDVQFRGGKEFWEKTGDGRARAYGLTRMPLTFDPPVKAPEDLTVAQQAKGSESRPDRAADGRIRCWLQGEPVRTLPNLARVPAVVVTAEASFHATYDDCTVAFLTQAGARPDVVRLADQGLHGNGHMMMLETNSDAVADVLAGWLAGRVK
ncbi:pimeloyl-ACP methyl ester carboxylesterase [Methylobacterium sp. PvP062]|uniref:Pimeloyl-ACP methyl ester carboxylesterase n=1 Tax=Methylobacterium radiotolerans TaxID=31998 RepID=A0ABV2NRM7_9HYPH|nr:MULTISPECIES: alpha/beta hydrolase [unclassified Methylobacterium]MBP2494111.1 pimeloyl-ACP methyl ester carboxylesterase [Methylobacterium sp. PvP105]MBP2499515.1 pimeloyl-ACP methyl ester carboxylesterase [Methylobacterium sp. PvP109]